jgi:hypothetical protein
MSEQVQEFTAPLTFDFSVLQGGTLYSDCTINVEGQPVRSHRVLLAGCSKVFSQKFSDDSVVMLDLPDLPAQSFHHFLDFLYSGRLSLSNASLPGLLRVASELEIKSLFDLCSEFVDQISSARTVLPLLRQLSFALHRLPNFSKFAAALIEAVQHDTNFEFLTANEFKLLISHARFTSTYVRDDLIRKYITATAADPERFAEFADGRPGELEDTVQRTAYSAVFICSPPDAGLLRSMESQINVLSSGMLDGRDPSSVIQEKPKRHWFTESEGNAWVLIEFTELFIQPTDYAIWSHGGASTLRNWAFQASNDRLNWIVLSTHRNDESIRAPFSTATWPVNTNGFFKYFRILQTGNNWSGNRWLYMLKMEIWGIACSMDL